METTTQAEIAKLVEAGADPDAITQLIETGAEIDEIAAYHATTGSLPKNTNCLWEAIIGQYDSEEHFMREYVADMYDTSEPATSYFDYSKYWECELSHYYTFDRRTGYVLMAV